MKTRHRRMAVCLRCGRYRLIHGRGLDADDCTGLDLTTEDTKELTR